MMKCPKRNKCGFYPGACTGFLDDNEIVVKGRKLIICESYEGDIATEGD